MLMTSCAQQPWEVLAIMQVLCCTQITISCWQSYSTSPLGKSVEVAEVAKADVEGVVDASWSCTIGMLITQCVWSTACFSRMIKFTWLHTSSILLICKQRWIIYRKHSNNDTSWQNACHEWCLARVASASPPADTIDRSHCNSIQHHNGSMSTTCMW